MSLQHAAQHLAQQGRGPDTTLVHMGQGEVDALQGLARAAGGSLTINPQTGLAEAGFLQSILPTLAGAVLTPLTGGVINPFTMSMLVGGATGLATGSLEKGLMAGLGAYGGAGIATGLGAAGAAGAEAAATPLASTATSGAAGAAAPSLAAIPAATPAVPLTGLGSGTFGVEQLGAGTMGGITPPTGTLGALGTGTSTMSPASFSAGPNPFAGMTPSEGFSAIGRGATGENMLNYATTNPKPTAAAFAPMAMDAMTPKPYKDKEDKNPGQQYRFEANATSPTPEVDLSGRGQRYFDPRYIRAAQGGIMQGLSSKDSHLGSYSDGGRLLRGPGDGVSDSIPATIGGKQPARLADGEFVIPARIVSELGNGSTEAGAKQLYAMMDRIQRARGKTTGKKQVAAKTNARKMMPA